MEFVEVMRQWARMCGANNYCSTCRMQKENLPYTLCSEGGIRSVENIADAEFTIMSWAAENPEPVYPTFREWLISIGVIDQMSTHSVIADTLAMTPIPAEIAQRLGIEPKGES